MIVYLQGSDSFLARETIQALKEKYLAKNPDGAELIEIDGDEGVTSWADLRAAPLFATSRLIIIRRAGYLPVEEQKNLAAILTDLPGSTVVVIWDAKPLKAAPLSTQCEKASKVIANEPLGSAETRRWINNQATKLGIRLSKEEADWLETQHGNNLWAIQTDLITHQFGSDHQLDSGQGKAVKPFYTFDLVKAGRWGELRQHLISSYRRGEALELTLGALAAAVRRHVKDRTLQRRLVKTLSSVDIALKSGLIEAADGVALLACYLPDGQKRVQWEEVWEQST